MKISVGMLAEALTDMNPYCHFSEYDSCLNLERCVFFDGDRKLYGDTAYLFTEEAADEIPSELLSAEKGASVIYLGDNPEWTAPANASFIRISSAHTTAARLANCIQSCFEQYHKIDLALRQISDKADSIERIVKLATPLFQNEITVRDRSFRYVAQSYKALRHASALYNKHVESGELAPVEELEALKSNPDYHEQIKTEKPWLYHYDGHQMWCYDIFYQNNFIYRIKLTDTNHPFRPWDSELMNYFVQILQNSCTHLFPVKEKTVILDQLFASLITNSRYAQEQELKTALRNLNWEVSDLYQVICLIAGQNRGEVNGYQYYAIYLNEACPCTYSFCYQDGIVLIGNLTRGYAGDEANLIQKLAEFLREENFRAGLSMPYHILNHTAYAYKQASIALKNGLVYDPFIWSYHFKNYRYHYLKQMMQSELPSGRYILPELYDLIDHDESKGTSYVQTLNEYLKNNRNMLQAASKLNIHRSTLSYRLQRINDIMHINVVNNLQAEPLLRLFLYFHEFLDQ